MTKQQIEQFLISKRGYLKKSPLETAIAIWKTSSTHIKPKTQAQLDKELALIKQVQQTLRKASFKVAEIQNDEILELYHKIIKEKVRPKKVLLFDIEVSPNIVTSWRVGNKINISPDSIIRERAVICICYKWLDEDKVYSLQWKDGDDKEMLVKFSEIIESADEVITQNGDKFDIRWLRTRCIFHRIPFPQKLNSRDTLKYARNGFNFNSNKLNYMGQFLGVGEKMHTPSDLWTKVALLNDKKALAEMVLYCAQDVKLLENVYNELQKYVPLKQFKYGR